MAPAAETPVIDPAIITNHQRPNLCILKYKVHHLDHVNFIYLINCHAIISTILIQNAELDYRNFTCNDSCPSVPRNVMICTTDNNQLSKGIVDEENVN